MESLLWLHFGEVGQMHQHWFCFNERGEERRKLNYRKVSAQTRPGLNPFLLYQYPSFVTVVVLPLPNVTLRYHLITHGVFYFTLKSDHHQNVWFSFDWTVRIDFGVEKCAKFFKNNLLYHCWLVNSLLWIIHWRIEFSKI